MYKIAEEVFDQEITELKRVLLKNKSSFEKVVSLLAKREGKIVITGLGKSGLIGQKIAATLSSTGNTAVFLNAAEALHGDLGMVNSGDAVLLISNSAATVELMQMLPSLNRLNVCKIGLFGKQDTVLAQQMDALLDLGVEKEGCPLNLAPMSSSTVTLVMGDALAAALMKREDFTSENFALFHPGGSLGRRLLLRIRDVMVEQNPLPLVSPKTSLKEVLIEITRLNLGAVCVSKDAKTLDGIITDGDIRRFLLNNGDLNSIAEEIMTSSPLFINLDELANTALEIMEDKKIYVLPVIDNNQEVKGIVRMHDILSS